MLVERVNQKVAHFLWYVEAEDLDNPRFECKTEKDRILADRLAPEVSRLRGRSVGDAALLRLRQWQRVWPQVQFRVSSTYDCMEGLQGRASGPDLLPCFSVQALILWSTR